MSRILTNNALGFQKMPEGYNLWLYDEMHYVWEEIATEIESDVHWDKWAVYRGAKKHAEKETQ